MMRKYIVCFSLLVWGLNAASLQDVDIFYMAQMSKLKALKNEEKWEEVAAIGETLIQNPYELTDFQRYFILDQLIATYFRLGDFEKAFEHAKSLVGLVERLEGKEALINSLNKLSVTYRVFAQSDNRFFKEAKDLSKKALDICLTDCPNNLSLRGKVLFNLAAAICDDPNGDYPLGIEYYNQAQSIFSETGEADDEVKTLMQLSKAYLLTGDLQSVEAVLDRIDQSLLEVKTLMHFFYLKAQTYHALSRNMEALEAAQESLKIALSLNANADVHRLKKLIEVIQCF
jgi:tetratricopeptide (TPR) repeat protein